jgi:hypothetical protein
MQACLVTESRGPAQTATDNARSVISPVKTVVLVNAGWFCFMKPLKFAELFFTEHTEKAQRATENLEKMNIPVYL